MVRNIRNAAAVAMVTAATFAVVTPAAQATEISPMHYSCGQARPPQLDGSAIRSAIAPANVYRGSSVGCGVNGSMQLGDKLDYYCFTVGNDGETWTYLSVYERGFAGWVLDVYLPGSGSLVHCPI
jgi:hypothetical protein